MLLYEEETHSIIGACIEVHKQLGTGFLEAVYQEALSIEFDIRKIPYKKEKSLPVVYKGKELQKKYYADFICYGKIIIELKAVTELASVHKAQVINYLKATNNKIGLLINFGDTTLKWERISCF